MENTFKDIKYGKDQLYKIWLYVDGVESLQRDNPRTINYKTGLNIRLQPEYTITKGYLTKVEYFADADDENSLILSVSIEYDEENKTRTTTREWTTEHGDFGDYKKVGVKRYNQKQWARVQIRRRENIVEELTAQAEQFGILTYVQTLFRSLDAELNSYKGTGDTKLVEKIMTYSGQWLETPSSLEGVTLRQAIIGQLTYQV